MKMRIVDFVDVVSEKNLEVGGVFAVYQGFVIACAEWDVEDGWGFYDFQGEFIAQINHDVINGDTELDVFQIGEFNG